MVINITKFKQKGIKLNKNQSCQSKVLFNLKDLSDEQIELLKQIKASVKNSMLELKDRAKKENLTDDFVKEQQNLVKQKHREKLPKILTKEQLDELKSKVELGAI